jgi:hypothetical protein
MVTEARSGDSDGFQVMILGRLAVVKRKLILSLVLIVGCSQLALAENSSRSQNFATAEAILDKCAGIDRTQADLYRDEIRAVARLMSSEPGDKDRSGDKDHKSADHKPASVSVVGMLGAVPAADAIKTCRRLLVKDVKDIKNVKDVKNGKNK